MSAILALWSRVNRSRLNASHHVQPAAKDCAHSFSWSDDRVLLAGTVSDYLPEDRFDAQPLWGPDGSCCLIADVRLDNRFDLVRELHLTQPEQLADSSILLAAWLRWGSSCVDHLLGGFAFAVWSPRTQQLFAARDHAGERPLHYHVSSAGEFMLASMPQQLIAPDFTGFDGERIASWLGCVPTPQRDTTFLASILRVPPGHKLLVTRDAVKQTRYWHPTDARPTRFRHDNEYAEALVEILDRATEARLRSSAPIGALLSAGLDSGAVCSSAATLLARSGHRLTAFTAVPRPEFTGASQPWQIPSEGAGAAELARMYPNIDHLLVHSAGRDLVATMKQWTDAMSEPIVTVVNLLWGSAIYEQARTRGVRVMLEGTVGNGTISWGTNTVLGYLFRRARWAELLQNAIKLRRNGGISARAAARFSLAGLLPGWCDYALLPKGARKTLYQPLMRSDLPHSAGMPSRIFVNAYEVTADPVAEQTRLFERFDFANSCYAVRSMFDIDVRDPTADKRVYEFCFSIPPEQYVVDGHSRSLIRRAMKGRIPESTRLGYKRGLQGADWYITVAEALPAIRNEVREIEASPAAREWIDMARLHALLENWPSSGYEKTVISNAWQNSLLRAVSLGYFLRTHDPALHISSPVSVSSGEVP